MIRKKSTSKIYFRYIENNQLVIFDTKNISKNECAARVFLTPYDASE